MAHFLLCSTLCKAIVRCLGAKIMLKLFWKRICMYIWMTAYVSITIYFLLEYTLRHLQIFIFNAMKSRTAETC